MKRRPQAPKPGSQRARILDLFRRPAAVPMPTGDKLTEILPKGISPIDEVADRARERYALRREGDIVAMSPAEIARKLSIPGPSVRRELARMLSDGDVEHLGSKYILAGSGEESEEEQRAEVVRWRAWVRQAARDAGWDVARAENKGSPIVIDGVAVIIAHSPNHGGGKSKAPPRGPSGGGGGPTRWGGRKLRASYDQKLGRDVAVMATPMSSVEILDDDRRGGLALDPPPGAFAYADTANGRHWYRRWSQRPGPWPYQDAQFVAASRARSNTWHERLFDDDGERRMAPTALPNATEKDRKLAEFMASAWEAAQGAAEARGMNRTRDRIPGEDDE